jgi:hypothetical protein
MHIYFNHPVEVYHYSRTDEDSLNFKHLFLIESDIINLDDRLNDFYEIALGFKNFTLVNYKKLNVININHSRPNLKQCMNDLYIMSYLDNMQKKASKVIDAKYKTIHDPVVDKNRIYFHSVTGKLRQPGDDDIDYELSESEKIEFLEDNINSYADICEEDKTMFKLWNRFIVNIEEVSKSNFKKLLMEFVIINKAELVKIKECLLLHFLTMYDQQKLNPMELKECIEYAAKIMN